MRNEAGLADHLRTTWDAEDVKAVAALDWDGPPLAFKWKKVPAGHIVYFVGAETGPVKIGWTQQPIKQRLKCLQSGSPVKLHVLAILPAVRAREAVYHREFSAFRLHGEWFARCPEIEAEIARLDTLTTRGG